MSHTPGPWEVHHWGDNEGDIHGSDGKVVCVMRDGATPQEEDWGGDARLIAAAPELLAALKKCKQALKNYIDSGYDEDEDQEAYTAAMAALRKAEGRE